MQSPVLPQNPAAAVPHAATPEIDPIKLQALMEQMKGEQNLLMGFIGGCFAGLVGSIIWAVITYLIEYQIGWMAILNGFLVGYTIRSLGRGLSKGYGVMGGILALISCLLGNILAIIFFIARQESAGLVDVTLLLGMNPGVLMDVMWEFFSPIDLLFYGIALYEGYKFSIRRITKQDLITAMRQGTAL